MRKSAFLSLVIASLNNVILSVDVKSGANLAALILAANRLGLPGILKTEQWRKIFFDIFDATCPL